HGAVRVDRDRSPVVRDLMLLADRGGRLAAETGGLDEWAEADADVPALLAQRRLALAQRVVVQRVARDLHRLAVAAAVVVHAGGAAIRLRARAVLQAELERIAAERARRVVDQHLARGVAGRPADAPVRPR